MDALAPIVLELSGHYINLLVIQKFTLICIGPLTCLSGLNFFFGFRSCVFKDPQSLKNILHVPVFVVLEN